MKQLHIRHETGADTDVVRDVVTQDFADVEYSDGSEPAIVDALGEADALTVSLVALEDQEVIGHVAASPVTIGDGTVDWAGIGPVTARPDRQGRGVCSALMEHILAALCDAGAAGAVLPGEPEFYSRFDFRPAEGLTYPGGPAEYFLALSFTDDPWPVGEVSYHPAFNQ